eukprot:Sspe_Gene.44493::Locus_21824_Transcript_2_2_Confidence_0.667_Length_3979::g.44493::m.44493/K06959/tex; protein Tex
MAGKRPRGSPGKSGGTSGAASPPLKKTRADQPPDITTIIPTLLPSLPPAGVREVVTLLLGGATIPFIARYRKDATGNLCETAISEIQSCLRQRQAVEEKRVKLLAGLPADAPCDVRKALVSASTLPELEELYEPYKTKKATLAARAKELGLEPLADIVLAGRDLPPEALEAISLPPDDVTEHVSNIVAGKVSHNPALRQLVRRHVMDFGRIESKLKVAKPAGKKGEFKAGKQPSKVAAKKHPTKDADTFRRYFDFTSPLSALRDYQYLAIARGERSGVLSVKVVVEGMGESVRNSAVRLFDGLNTSIMSSWPPHISKALEKGLVKAIDKHLVPYGKRAALREIADRAHAGAVKIFAHNVYPNLARRPLKGATILAFDPGYSHGTKCAVVGPTGAVLDHFVIFPLPPANKTEAASRCVLNALRTHHVTHIGVGDGRGGREVEEFVFSLLRSEGLTVPCTRVSERGASVYSASPIARKELPHLDVTIRGAVFIARSLIDPLSERCKVSPEHLGVGQYQHDLKEKDLKVELDLVVQSVVSSAGVDLNTAGSHLLRHVPGLTPCTAEAIVQHREGKPFTSRADLRKVKGIGPKSYQQCAGFLRVYGGKEPLDSTSIHPESYGAVLKLLQLAGLSGSADVVKCPQLCFEKCRSFVDSKGSEKVQCLLGVGQYTLDDLLDGVKRAGLDPRVDFLEVPFRDDIVDPKQLKVGMEVVGVVTNLVEWGAFIDIGLERDALLPKRYRAAAVGRSIEVIVAEIRENGQISLRRSDGTERPRGAARVRY